jgi:hypothetical protein
MAVKRIVPELCPECGQKQATLRPNGSVAVSHNCPKAPPGPPMCPVIYMPGHVIFEPANRPAETTMNPWRVTDPVEGIAWKVERDGSKLLLAPTKEWAGALADTLNALENEAERWKNARYAKVMEE